jgi:uncharacterized membrane protein
LPPDDKNPDELRQEIAVLQHRVTRLEAALAEMKTHGVLPQSTPMVPPPASPSGRRSIETTIGSQWLNRVGIVAVLVGMALFLKLAIENHWLGPAARIAIGLIGGLGLMVFSEPFRRRYLGFSYSLKGIGSGILYLTFWASFTLFHLLAWPIVAVGMILVTAGNGLLAWKQNSRLLAIYAVLGGLASPLLVADSANHAVALFSYLLLLTLGAASLAILRFWNLLLLLAFLGSAVYAAAWAIRFYTPAQFGVTLAFAFAGFLLFAAVPVAFERAPTRSDSLTLLALLNAVGGVIVASELFHGLPLVFVVLGIALFYFAITRYQAAARNQGSAPWATQLDANLALLIGVTLWIHWLWKGNVELHGVHTGEQLSYSFWFMGFGAALVALGLWHRIPSLRWQGLVLLLVSITKVFLFDMHYLSESYRVFSFLGLGLLLLVVSFVYQRDWLKLRSNSQTS